MSEFEDADILADIHALEEVLVQHQEVHHPTVKDKPQQHDYNDDLLFLDCTSSTDENNYLDTNRDIDADQESLNAYEINRRLIDGLTIAKKKLTILLQECNQKIKQLDEKMKNYTDISNLRIKCPVSIIGMPYFKDKDNFSAPKNSDTKLKTFRGELFLLSLKKPIRWSEKDRDRLLKAIHNQAIESVLINFNSDVDDEESNKRKQNDENKKIKLILPKSINELVKPLGEREFDWHKISIMDFNGKHSPEECRAMWNVYLHPQIRKSEWTITEDKRLLRYAKQHRFQDWDSIASKLERNRSAYQCFIRYNTVKTVPFSGHAWSKAEDNHLVRTIDTLKIGDYIPWSEIASYLWHRTKQQIYARWTYRKAPHLKKGRFTLTETEALLKATKKYGKDFSKISNVVMPNRTSVQLSEHYYTLMKNKNGENIWTIDDDMRLIELHKKYGNDWSKIQTMHFFRKTRTQVRHRFNSLLRYTKKGISIECIPRQHSVSYKNISINNKLEYHDKNTSTSKKLPTIDITDIQLRLYETFCFPPSIKMINFPNEFYDLGQLACEAKNLYNILNLFGVNLNISHDFLYYIHVDKREKQLLISLKEYINERDNRIQNDERIENLRLQMFNNNQNISENTCFIPPIPFCGYTGKTGKVKNKMQQSIDYIIDYNENFLVDTPTEFPESPIIESFLSIEEKNQFDKFSQFLISCHYETRCERQNINLNKLLEFKTSFDERNVRYNIQERTKSNNFQETTEPFNKDNKKTSILSNIVLPNRATLLGFKNLLLWKLLYEYHNKSNESSSLIEDNQKSIQTMTIHYKQNNEYKRAYKLLRTRLYQLFKFPITLSNTTLEICNPDTVFLSEKANQQTSEKEEKVSRKRKYEDIDSVQSNKRTKVNILADNNSQQNVNIKTSEHPIVHSSKHKNKICKKYKIIIK